MFDVCCSILATRATVWARSSMLTHVEVLMFPRYRHTPIFDAERKRCSVCRRAVYSLAGIHPQCANRRAIALESKIKREAAAKAGPEITVAAVRTDDAFFEESRRVITNSR